MDVVVVMVKAPRAGAVKTRLAAGAGIGAEAAARLAAAFLGDTLATLRAVRAARVLAHAPADAATELGALDPEARLVAQPEAGLGERLVHAFDAAFALGATRALAIGADAPHLPAALYERAFAALAERELVLGPALDGGYYLLGLRAPCPALFAGIEWSSARVLAQTRAAARAAGLTVAELEAQFDVDEPADLARLRELLEREPARAPRTARLLAGFA